MLRGLASKLRMTLDEAADALAACFEPEVVWELARRVIDQG